MWHISVFKIQLENSKKIKIKPTSSAHVLTVSHTNKLRLHLKDSKNPSLSSGKEILRLVYCCPHCVTDPQCELQWQSEQSVALV